MFIRVWSKAENVGRDDCPISEQYVAIRHIVRLYSRKYEGDATIRYMIGTEDNTAYTTKETFEYLKSLKLAGQTCVVKEKSEKKPEKKTVSILGIEVGQVG